MILVEEKILWKNCKYRFFVVTSVGKRCFYSKLDFIFLFFYVLRNIPHKKKDGNIFPPMLSIY